MFMQHMLICWVVFLLDVMDKASTFWYKLNYVHDISFYNTLFLLHCYMDYNSPLIVSVKDAMHWKNNLVPEPNFKNPVPWVVRPISFFINRCVY